MCSRTFRFPWRSWVGYLAAALVLASSGTTPSCCIKPRASQLFFSSDPVLDIFPRLAAALRIQLVSSVRDVPQCLIKRGNRYMKFQLPIHAQTRSRIGTQGVVSVIL